MSIILGINPLLWEKNYRSSAVTETNNTYSTVTETNNDINVDRIIRLKASNNSKLVTSLLNSYIFLGKSFMIATIQSAVPGASIFLLGLTLST